MSTAKLAPAAPTMAPTVELTPVSTAEYIATLVTAEATPVFSAESPIPTSIAELTLVLTVEPTLPGARCGAYSSGHC